MLRDTRSGPGSFSKKRSGAGNRKATETAELTGIIANPPESRGSAGAYNSRDFSQLPARYDARHSLELAQRYVQRGAAGEPCADLAMQLGAAVMEEERTRLAVAVLAGGPHLHAQATALAAVILREAATGSVQAKDSKAEGGGK